MAGSRSPSHSRAASAFHSVVSKAGAGSEVFSAVKGKLSARAPGREASRMQRIQALLCWRGYNSFGSDLPFEAQNRPHRSCQQSQQLLYTLPLSDRPLKMIHVPLASDRLLHRPMNTPSTAITSMETTNGRTPQAGNRTPPAAQSRGHRGDRHDEWDRPIRRAAGSGDACVMLLRHPVYSLSNRSPALRRRHPLARSSTKSFSSTVFIRL